MPNRCRTPALATTLVALAVSAAWAGAAAGATVAARATVDLLRLAAAPAPIDATDDTAAGLDRAQSAWVPLYVVLPPGEQALAVRARVAGGGHAPAHVAGTNSLHGYAVALVRVARAALETAAQGGGPAVVEVDVEVETAHADNPTLVRLRPDAERAARERAVVERLVANPADVARCAPHPPAPAARHADAPHVATGAPAQGFHPTGDPSLDGSGVRYLIVTTEALAPAFQPLADWKTRRGVPTAIRSIEWIESRTRRGVDRAETLRFFLMEAYQLWGIEYVLLGGDSDVLPPRLAFSTIYGGGTAPADMYFACLDGTWNADGDAVWGEGATGMGLGESDLLPELAVGRAPVNDTAQAQLFVDKVIGYETPRFSDYQDRTLFLAEVLVPANWDSGQTISLNGAPGTEQMINQSVPPSFTTQRLYDTHWQYPGSTRLTRAAALAAMNAGVGVVNHLGHGFRYTMSCGDGSLVNSDADALVNGDRTFVLCMANCAAVAFDYNCLAERFLLNPNGGAAAVIGAARSVSASLIVAYNRALHRQLFELQHVHAGDLLNALRLERASFAEQDGSDRWIQFSLNALADPEMPIFASAVRVAAVAHVSSLPVGPHTLAVTVTASGAPVAGATVCAFKTEDAYAVATTNASGVAQLDIGPRQPGALEVTVSGQNLAVATSTVTITPVATPVLALADGVLDDSAPSGQGNGDGGLDAGETVAVLLSVHNHGTSAANGVVAQIGPSGPGYTILVDSVAVGTIGPGATAMASASCVVQVDADLPDGTALEVPVQFDDDLGNTWNDKLRLLACAPVATVARVAATAAPMPGRLQITVEVKNLGSGDLTGLTATLVPTAPGGVVTQSAMSWTDLAPLVTLAGAPAFEVVDPGAGGFAGRIDFQDAWRRTFSLAIDGLPPAAPATPTPDGSWAPGTVRLTWPPSTGADRLGYHVFRSTGGPNDFVRVTPDILLHSDYYDRDVVPNVHYEYYVVAVDSSRQWSAASPLAGINTIAAPLTGWPVLLAEPTASSVAVGDIDGDGGAEVVVGDAGVWAWHASGLEVINGDNDPTTDGLFSSLPGAVAASVALADVDAAPGLEVVGASWLTNAIYVWNGEGELLPGWPRQPFNGGNTGYWASPAIGQVDGHGLPEIVAISKDGNLYAWHHDGTPLLGTGDGRLRTVGAWTQTTPALADLDGDGACEIITSGSTAQVDVTRSDGTDFPGWPRSLFAFGKGSPAVGDIDGNGDLEIVITSESDHVWVFNHDGTQLPGWPRQLPADAPDLGPSPALGDLDGDGRLEIVLVAVKANPFTQTKLYVLNSGGDIVLQRPLELNTQSSPILADLDGDGGIDIVHGGEAGVLHAWDLSGNELSGFPIAIGDHVRGTPQYCDLDSDGTGELVLAGWNRTVYAWRMSGLYRRAFAPWPTFHGDVARTGHLPVAFPTPAVELPPPAELKAVWSPNPFNPSVRVALEIPGTGYVPVRVDLFDAHGRRVRRLVDEMLPAGLATRMWDGRDDRGRVVASGVYVYRVDAGGRNALGKLTLVR